MKDEKNENIKTIAENIIELEMQCQSGTNVSENLIKMEQLVKGLSLEELLAIDDYIMTKDFLTK